MSFSTTYELPWDRCDLPRLRGAIEQAIRDCAARRRPEYAESTLELDADRDAVHVWFPARLVELPRWELEPPTAEVGPEGYPCTFRHRYLDAMPEHELPGRCIVSLDSNTSANRDAWMTASHVLERAMELLGGTLAPY